MSYIIRCLIFASLMLPVTVYAQNLPLPEIKAAFKADTLVISFSSTDLLYISDDSLDINVEGLEVKSVFFPDTVLLGAMEAYRTPFHVLMAFKNHTETSFTVTVDYQLCRDDSDCSELKTYTQALHYAGDVDTARTAPKEEDIISSEPVIEHDTIATLFKNENLLVILGTFFGFGLLLSLTPCMLPMIPIISAVIVCRKEHVSPRKGFLYSLIYVLSMAVVYAGAGVVAASFGSNIQALFQEAWIIIAFAAIFVLLGLSMFDLFTLQMPAFVQSYLAEHSACKERRSIAGIVTLGVLSALIVGPCVAPPFVGALIYIGQTGDALLGALTLFTMGLGLGMPLLVIGAGAGRFMPKPGLWMESVKLFFGFFMFGFAIWMLSRILSDSQELLAWALLLIAISVYMGLFNARNVLSGHQQKLKIFVALIVFIYGVMMMAGGLSGATSANNPLKPFTGVYERQLDKEEDELFVTIPSDSYESVIKKSEKPVMLLFYADWCSNCKELEKEVFSDQKVRKAIASFARYRIDVTENTDADIALLKKFKLFGPPGILFFDSSNQELAHQHIVGYVEKKIFLEKIKNVKQQLGIE